VSFADLGVPADLVAALAACDITEPFPIQAATIADALAGHDVCGRAPTGSGKTLAFGVPLVARVPKAKPRRPRALILAPTRELAAQIQKELQPLAAVRGVRVFSIYGGVGYEPQKRAMRNGVEILVACPGRLEDLIAQRAVRLDAVEIMVIDEADRMADMGFLPAVRRILDQTAEQRQTLLFSATLDGDIAVLTREYQNSPVRHEVESPEDDWASAEHVFEHLPADDRLDRAAKVVADSGPTIVFTHTRRGADRVAKRLSTAGVAAAPIHGGLSQAKRDKALHAFRNGHVSALVATDVAARGIHVDDVACVLHFDPPVDTKTYVHRSGRTARAGATGKVVSFVTGDQRKVSLKMRRELGLAVPASEQTSRDRDQRDQRDRSPQGRNGATSSGRSQSGQKRYTSNQKGTRRGAPAAR
jgi:superfamily II DNA/RNA helicase